MMPVPTSAAPSMSCFIWIRPFWKSCAWYHEKLSSASINAADSTLVKDDLSPSVKTKTAKLGVHNKPYLLRRPEDRPVFVRRLLAAPNSALARMHYELSVQCSVVAEDDRFLDQ